MTNNNPLMHGLVFLTVGFTTLMLALPAMSNCETGGSAGTGLHDSIVTGTGSGGTGLGDSVVTGSGTGGTGIQDSVKTGSGSGGTGLQDLTTTGTGAAGTGFGDDDGTGTGTGGTGIFGVVTGFGSVCVNGFEIDYDAETKISRDGQSATVSDLAVGQTVRIATTRGRPSVAARIDVESALAGPIDRIDPASRRVWIMNQVVELRAGAIVFDRTTAKPTRLDNLKPGSHLSVSGLRRADGVVSASRLDQGPANEPAIVTAVVRDLGQGTAYVGDTRTSFSSIDDLSKKTTGASRDGQRLRVRGRWNAKTRTLEATRLEDAAPFDSNSRRVSIQGFVAPSRSGGDFRLAGTSVEVRHARAGAGAPELNIDALVRIEGRVDDQGRLRADRVIVDIPGRDGHPVRLSNDGRGSDKEDHDDRSGREDREDREDRSGRDRSERPERTKRSERPDRPERPERSRRSED